VASIDIKKDEIKTLKNKFNILEIFDDNIYALVNGQVLVIDKKIKKGEKEIDLEYEVVNGEYIIK